MPGRLPSEPQGTTLLLGANGTGKTAVLDVVYGLRKLLSGEAKITDPIAFPPSTLTRWQTHRHQQFILWTRVGNESFIYALQIEHDTASGTSWVAHEGLVAGDSTVLFSCTKGEVRLRNVATGSCMHVRPVHTVSSLDTVGLSACVDGSSTQEFTFLGFMRGVRLKRTSTGECISRPLQSASLVSGTTPSHLRVCEGKARVSLISDNGTDRYFLKEQSGIVPPGDQRPTMSDSCWAPALALNGSSITSQACDVSRDRFLWEIEEVG